MAKKKEDDWLSIIDYLNSLSARIADLEKQSKTNLNEVNQTDIYFVRSGHKIQEDLTHLKNGVAAAMNIVKKQQELIKKVVKDFKGIAKHGQLMVLKEKVEQWSPDKFITRKEFNEKLKATSDTSSQLSEPPAKI